MYGRVRMVLKEKERSKIRAIWIDNLSNLSTEWRILGGFLTWYMKSSTYKLIHCVDCENVVIQ